MDGMLPVPFLHTPPLPQPKTRRKQVGSEGPGNTVQRTVVPPPCPLGSGVCVSRSDRSRLATLGGCCCFPFPLCLGFTQKKNLNLGLGEPGFRTLVDLASSPGSVTFLLGHHSESVNGPGGGIGRRGCYEGLGRQR